MQRLDILFCGVGDDLKGITHWRTLVPARALGAMVVCQDQMGRVHYTERCFHDEPSTVIVQMPVFKWQLLQMQRAKSEGRRVLANVDDYLPSIPKMWKRGAHGHGHVFNAEVQRRHRQALETCDGIICSTPWLQKKYGSVNETLLGRNGLDLDRYQVPEVEHDTRIVGWSGGTGHRNAFRSIVPAIDRVLDDVPESLFVVQGDNLLADVDQGRQKWLDEEGKAKPDGRVAHFKWSDLWTYPRDMAAFWVGLAPAEVNDFYRAKSQLRFYEASAVGVPLVADPMYDEIRHGVDGFIATNEGEWYEYMVQLLTDEDLRREMSGAAKERAHSEFGMQHRAVEWDAAIEAQMIPDPVDIEAPPVEQPVVRQSDPSAWVM